MSVTQAVQQSVNNIPAGQIFGYRQVPNYVQFPAAVIKAVNRLVDEKRLTRLSKGQFYVPKRGLLGELKPTDSELLRTMLYKNGRLRGYVTGLSLYNKLGLTTQMPRTITLALNGPRQQKEFGTIRIKTLETRIPIEEDNVELLQYLDALKDIKTISDTNINQSLKIMGSKIAALSQREQKTITSLALDYYSAQVRALLGLLFSDLKITLAGSLKLSLNPTTIYKLKLDDKIWPEANKWNIR
jgi:hypothetical protein